MNEEKQEFEFYEEDGQIKKRPKKNENARGGVMTYEQMQEHKHKRILKEQREAEKAFDPEEDAKAMGVV